MPCLDVVKGRVVKGVNYVNLRDIGYKVEQVDVHESWNFQQIVNLDHIRAFNSVNLKLGYPILDIRSPREVIHEEEI